ncbi:MAG: DUF1631 family protein [Gammaproteobacteria bacterium]|nr:DUF1631 family protein [Gammaproteobacteria bacterium]
MNKRSLPRFPVTLDVTVTFPGKLQRVCTVRDYCAGGMYLLCSGERVANKDDSVLIEFSTPLEPQAAHNRLQARVARVAGNGIGIAFTGQNSQAVEALSRLAESQAAAGREAAAARPEPQAVGSESVMAALGECRALADEYLHEVLRAFFSRVNDNLFIKAGEARSNTQQSALFGAMNELRKGQDGIMQRFMARLNEQFSILTESGYHSPFSQQEKGGGELALVDSEVLDKWLMVRAMASKLEEHMEASIDALELRLESISSNAISLENNPVGPFVLASLFREALEPLVLDEGVQPVIFDTMEQLLQERLKRFYDDLNGILIAHGILPTISKKLEVVKVGGSVHAAAPATEQYPDETASAADAEVGGTGTVLHAGDAVAGPVADSTMQTAPREAVEAPVAQGASLPPLNYTRPGAQTAAGTPGGTGAQGVHELMRLQQQSAAGGGGETTPVTGYYSSAEVMAALAQIDRDGLGTRDPVEALTRGLEQGGDEGKALEEADRQKVGYVGGMIRSILQDQLLPQHAKPWFSTLQIPLLKAGLLDASLAEDEGHPARELLNRLESLGDRLYEDESQRAVAARSQIETVIRRVHDNVEEDANVFVDALEELEQLEESVQEDYDENVAALIERLERETELSRARREILQALNRRLGQREVPKVVLELLDSGWKNLLLRTYLKDGVDSRSYNNYLNIIDQLYARLMATPPYSSDAMMSDEVLLDWLQRMLPIFSHDAEQNERMLRTIKGQLHGESEEPLQRRYVPELVSTMVKKEDDVEAQKPAEVDDEIWQLMLLDAAELQKGESFCYQDAHGKECQVTLIWQDEQDPRYVFVDNTGQLRLDLTQGEVARELYQKGLTRLNEKSLSVTERATYHFLQQIHGQLAYQAQHDELTGLLNRKAFTRELEGAYTSARSGKSKHVLGYVDLDRFNVINTTCGHSEGDILLGKVAGVLQERLGENAVLGRLGGDEFGILLTDCGRTRGLKLLTEAHDAIRAMRFECENNEFKITASIGLAEINELSDSSGRLLSAVDAATFTAKEMGRDNIQIYNVENQRISDRRTILDWVGRINVLFDKNLIQLKCQKIMPVRSTVNSLPHYEVLLDVKDEDGNKVLLDEFIVAAERYNRIIDIDTWVVDYVLNWMDERRDKLDRISAISINLSGSSLGNRHFMEHIESSLKRPGFPAEKVCFEVTETIAINNLDNASRFMRMIKEIGSKFSLDDFGTGTSSYSYLKSLPIDYLKIDGAFVKDVATNTHDFAVVKSINEIGHAMGKKTVAEYVEDEFAYEALKQIGVDYVQGFGVEKPIPLYKLLG